MAERVEANYEELEKIAQTFGSEGQRVEGLMQQLDRQTESLETQWIGEGANSFFNEFRQEVAPKLKNLAHALGEASRVTKDVAKTLQEAEQEAGNLFKSSSGSI